MVTILLLSRDPSLIFSLAMVPIKPFSSNASGTIDGGSDVDTLNTQASFNSILLAATAV